MGKMELIYLSMGIVLGIVGSRIIRSSKEAAVSQELVDSTPPMPKAPEQELVDSTPPMPKAPEQELVDLMPPVPETPKSDNVQPLKEELKQAQLAYQMAHEMSLFKAGFLARTSHELRSPLSSLIGMHQLILSDLCDSPQEEREFVAQANASAQKMVKLLDELIAIAKTEHGTNRLEIRPLSLIQVFEQVELLTHMQAANRNIQLTVISPDPEIRVLADSRRFQQVLVGLVDSAIAQMEEGSIQVSATSVPESQVVHIQIDVQSPNLIWSESVDLLSSTPDPEHQPTEKLKISPGLTLLMVQTLVDVMQGRLELLRIPDPESTGDSAANLIRLQCSMPLATPESAKPGLAGE